MERIYKRENRMGHLATRALRYDVVCHTGHATYLLVNQNGFSWSDVTHFCKSQRWKCNILLESQGYSAKRAGGLFFFFSSSFFLSLLGVGERKAPSFLVSAQLLFQTSDAKHHSLPMGVSRCPRASGRIPNGSRKANSPT